MMALFPRNENSNFSSIIYKFDYSSCEYFETTSLNLKLNCVDDNLGCNWVVSISTHFDLENPKWEIIDNKINQYKNNHFNNLTRYVRNKKIFFIKVEILGEGLCDRRNITLFPQTKYCFEELDYNIEDNFELDIIVEFTPSKSNLLKRLINSNMKSKDESFNLRKDPIEKENSTRSTNDHDLIFGGLFNEKY